MIDRVGPTRMPRTPIRGYQRWRTLCFMHWEVPETELAKVVPRGLTVDTFDGSAYVGLVTFGMEGVRPRWSPDALAFDFLETNVRTYVHVDGEDPGVYFLSLDAASRIAVAVARSVWGLPYYFARMTQQRDAKRVRYGVQRAGPTKPKLELSYEVGEALGDSKPGSFEHFLVERYLLHLEKGGRIWTGQVHHTPYPVQRAQVIEIEDEIVPASGLPVSGAPPIVHYAEGVDVNIYDLGPRAQGSR